MSDGTYYEAKDVDGFFVGRLYRWEGDREVTIHKTEEFLSEEYAIDAIVEWAEDNGYDPQLG